MKKLGLIVGMILLLLAVNAAADTPDEPACTHAWTLLSTSQEPTCTEAGSGTYKCSLCGQEKKDAVPKLGHKAGDWTIVTEATCQAEGKKEKRCTRCKVQLDTATVAKKEHTYGSWQSVTLPTCTAAGEEAAVCTVCGHVKTRSVSKVEHSYGDWKLVRKATCLETGKEEAVCTVCGDVKSRFQKRAEHQYSEFKVTREPTCRAAGKKTATCSVCGQSTTKKINKLDHEYGEWVVTREPTDHTKGKRTQTCFMCGKKNTKDFYPDGTLYKGGDNPEQEVRELQQALTDLGLYKKKITGKYDANTAAAVKKLQKKNKLRQDGIAWPQTRRLLGYGVQPGEAILPANLPAYKLQLMVEQTSPIQQTYHVGDTLTYIWTLTNTSTKNVAKTLSVAVFPSLGANEKTDEVIAEFADLGKSEVISGVYEYTLTAEDAAAGSVTLGFVARGKLGKTKAASDTVCFINTVIPGVWEN